MCRSGAAARPCHGRRHAARTRSILRVHSRFPPHHASSGAKRSRPPRGSNRFFPRSVFFFFKYSISSRYRGRARAHTPFYFIFCSLTASDYVFVGTRDFSTCGVCVRNPALRAPRRICFFLSFSFLLLLFSTLQAREYGGWERDHVSRILSARYKQEKSRPTVYVSCKISLEMTFRSHLRERVSSKCVFFLLFFVECVYPRTLARSFPIFTGDAGRACCTAACSKLKTSADLGINRLREYPNASAKEKKTAGREHRT